MPASIPAFAAAAAALTATLVAVAQTPATAPRARPADPADASIAVPAPAYRSAFAGYRRLADAPLVDWKAANDEVERIGGWRAYAREAAAPAPAAASAPERARVPQPPTPAQRP